MDMNVSLMVYNHRWGYEDMSGIYGRGVAWKSQGMIERDVFCDDPGIR